MRDDFGSRLRAAREGRGVSLREIANRTKISVRVLDALERNEIALLPGGIFSRGFVRAYAVEAGLDPDAVVDDFIRSFPDESVTAGHPTFARAAEQDSIESDRRMASVTLTLLLVSVPLAGALFYVGFSRRDPPAAVSRDAVSNAEARLGNPAIADAGGQPVGTEGVKVEIVAARRLDVSVAVDGRAPIDVRLSEGARRTFEAERDLFLTVSDATAFEWTINGLPGHRLGPGAASTVHLTPDNFRDYTNPR
jgi:cytoskeletal protein RodZ